LPTVGPTDQFHPPPPVGTIALVLLHPPSSCALCFAPEPYTLMHLHSAQARVTLMSARLSPSTSCLMLGSALRTRALHWRSSVPEPLSSRATQPVCSPFCGTTTHAQLPRACSHPTRVPWRPGPMRPTIANLRPHHRPNQSACRCHLVVRAEQSACTTCRGQRRSCDNVAPCAPRALLPNRPAAPLPCTTPASVA
jgi:hypothetical protein